MMRPEVMMGSIEFYQKHLDRVSRSFAFCIARLEGPLRAWVSLTYLVCRILDTVEDAPWKKTSEQLKEFDRFDRLLACPSELASVTGWEKVFPADIPAGERHLLQDTDKIFSDLHSFPAKVKLIIQEMVGSMSAGMRHFCLRRSPNGELRLAGLQEVNQYCFFVAGVVGEILTQLLGLLDSRLRPTRQNLLQAHHFGLFLQKINLLKDQRQDESGGRFLIPSREDVMASLGQNAHGAFSYIKALPVEHRDFRLFCAWSFYLGLGSLPYIQKSFSGKDQKIPRVKAWSLLNKVEGLINDNEALEKLMHKLLKQASVSVSVAPSSETRFESKRSDHDTWFLKAYRGQLTSHELAELGITA